MPALELRPALREDFDGIVGLLTAAELPVEDLDGAMLNAFVVATDGEEPRWCRGARGVRFERAAPVARGGRVNTGHSGTRREPRWMPSRPQARDSGRLRPFPAHHHCGEVLRAAGLHGARARRSAGLHRGDRGVFIALSGHRPLPLARPLDLSCAWSRLSSLRDARLSRWRSNNGRYLPNRQRVGKSRVPVDGVDLTAMQSWPARVGLACSAPPR